MAFKMLGDLIWKLLLPAAGVAVLGLTVSASASMLNFFWSQC